MHNCKSNLNTFFTKWLTRVKFVITIIIVRKYFLTKNTQEHTRTHKEHTKKLTNTARNRQLYELYELYEEIYHPPLGWGGYF